MKKILLAVVFLLIGIVLLGCTQNTAKSQSPSNASNATANFTNSLANATYGQLNPPESSEDIAAEALAAEMTDDEGDTTGIEGFLVNSTP